MNKIQALNQFWNSFGLTAYSENSVPDDAQLPYITYEVSNDFFEAEVAQTANIYYRSTSWKAITDKEQEIAEGITRGGKLLTCDEGAIWIKRATPWAQRMSDQSDDSIKRIVLNYTVEFIM